MIKKKKTILEAKAITQIQVSTLIVKKMMLLIRTLLLKRLKFQKIKYLIWGKILNGQIPIGILQKELMEDLQ